MAGGTVAMVAHRMRTVRRADRIVFLAGGGIVEEAATTSCCATAAVPGVNKVCSADGGGVLGGGF
jgi:ABC-type bacteriocin/lantibiotic exporter with double-glycine peptidase domain